MCYLPEGYEFGYYTYDTLPTMEVSNIETTQDTSSIDEKDVEKISLTYPWIMICYQNYNYKIHFVLIFWHR